MQASQPRPFAAPAPPADRPSAPKIVLTKWHRLTLLAGMASAIETILTAIDQARDRVWIETYIVRHDKLGHKLAERLRRARERGVDVRLLYDAVGSKNTDARFFEALGREGVRVRCYRPPGPLYLGRGRVPRDHSRILVIDEQGFTGGSAWGDEWLPCDEGGQGWHDVVIGLEGPGVADLAYMFQVRWTEAPRPDLPPSDCTSGDRYPDLEIVSDAPVARRMMFERHVFKVREAKRRVWIENSYFFAPRLLLDELERAARRGVDVRLILPRETDLPNVQWAGRGEYADWTRRGIKVYEYTRTVMHSKFAVIDDDWATVGTFNINPVSLHWVNELNVFVRDGEFVARVAALFEHDLGDSELIDAATIASYPPLERARSFFFSRFYRAVERITDALDRRHTPYVGEGDEPPALTPGCSPSRPRHEDPLLGARPPPDLPSAYGPAGAPWRLVGQTALALAGLFAAVATLAYSLRQPLERLAHGFVERFGLPGMALGAFLADGVHFPVAPQWYLLAAVADSRADTPAVAAVCLGSMLGGVLAFHIGRALAHAPFLRRRVAGSRPLIDALLARFGGWSAAVAAATPIPFSFFCYLAGAYRLSYRFLALLALCRVPRLLVFYALIRLGWSRF